MNTSQAWVELAVKTLSCSQKDLARQIGVSQTQISKWKSGEHMSFDMEKKFRTFIRSGDMHPEFILWAGSLEDADKWSRLIYSLAEEAEESSETGYYTSPLQGEPELLCAQISDTLRGIGIEPPKAFPSELELCLNTSDGSEENEANDDEDFDPSEQRWDLLDKNPYSAVIRAIFDSLNDVWGFYVAYVDEPDNDDASLYDTRANIEACMLDLAACKIEVDEVFAPKVRTFRHRVTEDYREWLTTVKDAAFRSGTPLRAELLDMVGKSADELGHAAEAESLGFNKSRLHPDVYMNELLVGIRTIHQVLPAILKKLDIDDFRLDESGLHI